MSLIQQHTVNDSTILISYPNEICSPEFLQKMADFLKQQQLEQRLSQHQPQQNNNVGISLLRIKEDPSFPPSSPPLSPMNPFARIRKNDQRLDSAICMPSAKKPTATNTKGEIYKKNESLERWVNDLLKDLDNIMSTNLNTDLSQDNNRRVKEVN